MGGENKRYMNNDKFNLGNFSRISDSEERENLDEAARAPAPVETTSAETDVIKHPEAKSGQAKFRSPIDGSSLREISLERIIPNEFQPRRIFNEEKLNQLAESIREHGIIQPLVVIPREDGKYEILVGERRFRASKIAGLMKVPAFIREKLSNRTKLELALIENVQRTDLNPIEEAKAYQQLNQEFEMKVQRISESVGKSAPAISNLMRLLKLPAEVQRALVEEAISEGQARPLLTLGDREEILQMFEIIKRDSMKVRDIESKVREITRRKIKVKEMFKPDPFLDSLENVLRNKLGTRVAVNRGAKGGKITIEFFSDEELNDIIDKIA